MEETKEYRDHREIAEDLYLIAESAIGEDDFSTPLTETVKDYVTEVVNEAEQNKGMLAVLITLFCHKIFDPEQDIRNHQASIANGFGGRTIDSKYITPFLKSKNFPAMAESGWLTRAFEHPEPYTLNYKISLKKKSLAKTFLNLIDQVQVQGVSAEDVLVYFFKLLIKQRDERNIALAKPHSLSISQIISVLEKHFNYKYSGHGASRLPTIAIYAAYQCVMREMARYNGKGHRHGCQVIVNGVYSTLRYYLRLLKNPAEFIERYAELLQSDEDVKYPQQMAWNEINSH